MWRKLNKQFLMLHPMLQNVHPQRCDIYLTWMKKRERESEVNCDAHLHLTLIRNKKKYIMILVWHFERTKKMTFENVPLHSFCQFLIFGQKTEVHTMWNSNSTLSNLRTKTKVCLRSHIYWHEHTNRQRSSLVVSKIPIDISQAGAESKDLLSK